MILYMHLHLGETRNFLHKITVNNVRPYVVMCHTAVQFTGEAQREHNGPQGTFHSGGKYM